MLNHWIEEFDHALKTLTHGGIKQRPNPARYYADGIAGDPIAHHTAEALMRVNHVGEICAQALYRAQSTHFSEDSDERKKFLQAAQEEEDHLVWCAERLDELCGRQSYLNVFWYAGAYMIGKVFAHTTLPTNLAFLEETERQVCAHLQRCLQRLPQHDWRSRAILAQMLDDENKHAQQARDDGASTINPGLRFLMQKFAACMVRTAYFI